MPITLPKDRQLKEDELALYVQSSGKLVDAYSVEYEVINEETGAKIAPGATRQDVTSEANFATGCYSLYNLTEGAIWTPDTAITRGTVVWYYTLEEGGEEFVIERPFAVVPTTVTRRPVNHLGRIQDLVEAGITNYSSKALLEALVLWTKRVERYCRRSFSLTRGTRRFRWRPGTHVMLSDDVFAVESMKPVLSTANMDLDKWEVFGCATGHHDNPHLESIYGFSNTIGGQREILTITGVWGTVDRDTLDAPFEVQAAIKELLPRVLEAGTDDPFEFSVGPLKREKTDGHEVEYATVTSEVRSGMLGLLKSAEVRDQLDLWRAPIGIAMTGAF